MGKPFEIVAHPFTLYLAPVGTAFPLIDAAPAVDWVMVGTSGDLDYEEKGVTAAHSQNVNLVRSAGSTGPRKAFRTEEGLVIGLSLMDISLEQYALALNSNTVATTAAGVAAAGFKALSMYRGTEVALMSLLARGDASAYGAGWKSQYEVPVCFQSADAEPVFTKGEVAMLALEFTALEDPDAATPDARFGRIVMQHAAALG